MSQGVGSEGSKIHVRLSDPASLFFFLSAACRSQCITISYFSSAYLCAAVMITDWCPEAVSQTQLNAFLYQLRWSWGLFTTTEQELRQKYSNIC